MLRQLRSKTCWICCPCLELRLPKALLKTCVFFFQFAALHAAVVLFAGAFGALDPEQKPEGEGESSKVLTAAEHFRILLPGFWTEASVDTFDEFLRAELPVEALNAWEQAEQAASRSTRSASSGSPHHRPLKAGLDTAGSTSQAKPAEFSSHSGPLRKGSGAERTQSPESPDERTEHAEQQHQQNQQNDPQLLGNELPVAQRPVGPASNHSKLRRGSKTTAGRSKDARDRAREFEKAESSLGFVLFCQNVAGTADQHEQCQCRHCK